MSNTGKIKQHRTFQEVRIREGICRVALKCNRSHLMTAPTSMPISPDELISQTISKWENMQIE